jgi:ArsR family metal-binding transcriptional regulator
MISETDREKIRKFESIRQRGMYASGQEVTEVYNRVLNKRLPSTNCGSCIRQRIQEMVTALNKEEEQQRKAAEAAKALEEQNKPEAKVTKKKK